MMKLHGVSIYIMCDLLVALFSLLITNPQKRYVHRFLIAINGLLVLSSLHIFLFYRSAEQFYIPVFSEVNWAIPLLYGLLLWLYTLSLIQPAFKMKGKHWLHFLPFIAFVAYLFIPLALGQSTNFDQHRGYPILKLIVNPLYLIAVVLLLKKHDRRLKDQYSFVGKMHHYWLSSLAIGGLALWLISCISLLHHALQPESTSFAGDYILLSVLSIYMFAMSYVGFSKTEIFQNRKKSSEFYIPEPAPSVFAHAKDQAELVEDIKIKPEPNHLESQSAGSQSVGSQPVESQPVESQPVGSRPAETSDPDQQMYNGLLKYMDEHKPYLNPALSLQDLSLSSHISSAKLSSIINHIGNKNFYDFINAYRVQEVQLALKRGDTKNFSLLGIAEASGFNSKASFYRTFKKVVGMTPSQYAKGL